MDLHGFRPTPHTPRRNTMILSRIIIVRTLITYMKDSGARVFRNVTFTSCDFQGHFYNKAQIVFDHCHFVNCDLSLSTWENVKFSKCNFNKASFGQAIIKNCEFRSCKWSKIAISPNGTELFSTYFSNPSEFISAASTNLDTEVLREHAKSAEEQALRLQNTKATIARRILKMLQEEGDEDAFYDAVKTFMLQNATSEMASKTLGKLELKTLNKRGMSGCFKSLCLSFQWFAWLLEREVLRIFGAINRWGASVTRPVGCMLVSFLVFSLIYEMFATTTISAGPIQKSFDISILAGYSNYHKEENIETYIMQNIQIIISVIFYALFFSTIINRVSRVR
jgi:uncharacterized protein YjbI with pentapeptide repeats